jgi:hypothetical protein
MKPSHLVRALVVAAACSAMPSCAVDSTATAPAASESSCVGDNVRFDGELLVFADGSDFGATYQCLAAADKGDGEALAAFEAAFPRHRSLRRLIADETAALVEQRALNRDNLPDLMHFPDAALQTLVDHTSRVRIGGEVVSVTSQLLGRDVDPDVDPGDCCRQYRNVGRWDVDGDEQRLSSSWAAVLPLANSTLAFAGTSTRSYRVEIVDGGYHLVPGGVTRAARGAQSCDLLCDPDPRSSDVYVDRVSLIQSNFGVEGNFEVVATRSDNDGGLQHYYRVNDGTSFPWIATPEFNQGYGYVAVSMIQGHYGGLGNFELVVARAGGLLEHFYRDNDEPNPFTWHPTEVFGHGAYTGVSMIESSNGDFIAVASIQGGGLQAFYRPNASTATWSEGVPFSTDIEYSAVSLIESNDGTLEFVAAQAGGSLEHFTHPGANITTPFTHVYTFGSEVYRDVSLIQGNYGVPGNYEVVAVRPDDSLQHWYRTNYLVDPTLAWYPGAQFGGGAYTGAALIQSSFGSQGNFEVVTSLYGPGLRHYYRSNDSVPQMPWIMGPLF